MSVIDITVYETAFQGRALEPQTVAGRVWCNGLLEPTTFVDLDFKEFTIHTNARDFDDFYDLATRAGLVLGTASGGVIVKGQ